ncbi:MAG: hypothetical protein A3E83_09005 [Gammaproteobacteria bacterium RIFCSPHIGHO2_12_FULL_41_20]|nr:MAG: hypothetical protein A3E83_09005 [Gammaproteobacteria bacterium RIFCSPHIGHO2_12_FULL_41_20]
MSIPEISVQELAALQKSGKDLLILDVRNPDEYAICNIGGLLIPANEVSARLQELNPDKHTIIHCHGGGRSRRVTEFLINHGFKRVFNLKGGITAWAKEIDPTMPTY